MSSSPSIGEKYISELKELFRTQGVQLYNGQHTLCLTSACLHYVQRKIAAFRDDPSKCSNTQRLADLEHLYDCLSKVQSLKLISDRKTTVAPSLVNIDLSVFRAVQSLVLKRIPVAPLTNLQRLREQLRVLIIQRSNLNSLEEVLVHCGGDRARAFAWSSLKELDLSVNSIRKLGDSLQYLPEVEYVNISNNQIGLGGWEGESNNSSSSINSTERQEGQLAVSGVQFIDKVKKLHLGFNQLTVIPEFGSRAKYNLTSLILRNNLLKDVKGLEVLDSLVELDLCENLISKHTNLLPLLNLHHLSLLWIVGNPLCYDSKYRLKVMECLSNLISPTSFQLDGKKLSAIERKAISHTLTHYSPPTTPVVTPSSSPSSNHLPHQATPPTVGSFSPVPVLVPLIGSTKYEEHEGDVKLNSLPSSSFKSTTQKSGRKTSTKKKPRVVVFEDDSEPHFDTSLSTSNSSIPLLSEERLTKHSNLRSQLKESWLSTADSFSSAGAAARASKSKPTEDDSAREAIATIESSPVMTSPAFNGGYYIESCSTDTSPPLIVKRETIGQSPSPLDTVMSAERQEDDKNGVFPMEDDTLLDRSLSPVKSGPTPQVTGNIFDVSMLESDTDEEHQLDHSMWISISDRFLQEIHNDVVQDQLDLQCLKSAAVERRSHRGKDRYILVLQLDYDRRDRRKREYVLNDEKEQSQILDQLLPIVQANATALPIATKLECFKCQAVIEWTEAFDAPLDSPASVGGGGFHSVQDQRQLGKVCPKCKGFLIQIGDSVTSNSLPQRTLSYSNSSPPVSTGFELNDDMNDPMSPGHIDLSEGLSYNERFFPSVEPRLSPVPPSPYPDMSPFQTPIKSTGLSPFQTPIKSTGLSSLQTPIKSTGLSPFQTPIKSTGLSPFQTPIKPSSTSLPDSDIDTSNDRPVAVEEQLVPITTEPIVSEEEEEEEKEEYREFGTMSDPTQLFRQHHSLNPFDEPNSLNPFDEPISSLSSLSSNDQRQASVASSNPFDDLPDELGSDSHTAQNKSQSTAATRVSKSLSLTHARPDSRAKEQESVSKQQGVSTNPVTITPRKQKSSTDIAPVSGSVPAESKLKSYFSTFIGKGKKEEELESKRKSGHSRSKSQDIRVPPLPDSLRERSIEKGHKAPETMPTATSSGGAMSKVDSDVQHPGSGSGGERKSSGSGSGGNKKLGRFSVSTSGRKRTKNRSSSETEETKLVSSSSSSAACLYKEDDPTYIHNNFTVYLSLEVFDNSKGETFELALKTPLIEYGDWNEIDSFFIVSNKAAYLYRVTAPESLSPESWLELKKTLPLKDLIFIEIGVGYQSLRLEYEAQCYTLLIRNEDKCRKFHEKLSFIVSDVSKSKFKGVRISQFILTHITDPHRSLREALLTSYDHPSTADKGQQNAVDEDEHLKIFLLAHKYIPHNDPTQVAVTVVLTDQHIYLALENPQWPLPRLHPLPDRDDLLPPYSGVIKKDITDVQKLVLYQDESYQFTLQFFKETSLDDESMTWTIVLKTTKSLQKFVRMLEQLWSEQMQQTLEKEFK